MDKIYKGYGREWVSEKINLEQYFTNFRNKLFMFQLNPNNSKTRQQCNPIDFIHELGVNTELYNFNDLEESCSADLLYVPGEPQPVNVEAIKARRGLYEGTELPNIPCPLVTLRFIQETPDSVKENPSYLKYTGTIWLNDIKDGPVDLLPYEEMYIVVRVYDPFRYITGSRNLKPLHCAHEIAVLGNHTLACFRDKIHCAAEEAIEGDQSENPDKPVGRRAKDIYKSGCIYIEDIFYNDFRDPNNIDYSEVIRKWAAEKSIGQLGTAVMETTQFKDLNVRFGYPYVYMHQGDCEHLIVFSDARLLHPEDPLYSANYPLYLTIGGKKTRYCMICSYYVARWVTRNNTRVPMDPCYFCDSCFKSFNYIDGKKVGNFKAYQFYDRAALL